MKSPKKVTLPTAVKQYSNINSFARHITTANFMEYSIARAKELCKNQTFTFDMRSTVRLKPMSNPTYGNIEIHNRAFFVPFRLVMPGFNDFDNDTPWFGSSADPIRIPNAHRIDNSLFVNLFLKTEMSTAVASADIQEAMDDETYDFVRYNNGDPQPYRFTPLGRFAYKILRQLGYGVYFNGQTANGYGPFSSVLPLLCWMRVYFDWYFPSMYVDDHRANALRRWFYVRPTQNVNTFTDNFGFQNLYDIFVELHRVSYDTDYYTGAWDFPVSPNAGSFGSFVMQDPTMLGTVNGKTVVSVPGDATLKGTPYIQSTDVGSANFISQFAIDALKSVTDFMRRNQISGARTIDRFIARWGSAPVSEKILRAQYIGEDIAPVRIGDVTATASSDGTPLGGYAGKGFGISNKDNFVSYTADERGMLIVISTIVPEPIYYQGVDRHTLHMNMLDFYTPEFDNKGVQAIGSREVYMPTGELAEADRTTNSINFDKAVFGFVPRYAEYKVEPSQITGDITLGSLNKGMEGWTLGRDLKSYFANRKYVDVVHSQEFMDGTDAQQYDRIFDIFDDSEDKFIVEHQFRINNRFPGAPLYDGYEFDSEGKASNVTMDVNGVRAN
ncbi:MAG: hypothetical protein J6V23_07570 [Bacteroidaceae bacterium]|nr:hypothetical protein [Bacteroidaceae bacterium]